MTSYPAIEVEVEDTEKALENTRKRGVYDDTRSIVNTGDTNQVPVTREIEPRIGEITYQQKPRFRKRGLDSHLPDDFLHETPSSWNVVGEVILVELGDIPKNAEGRIGEELLEIHSNCHTVLEDCGVSGKAREPEVRVVAGRGETETVHRENGVEFALDVSETMFSVGNSRERRRVREVVTENEVVYDMFAGIGYFTLPAAKTGAYVHAAEINPTAINYLRRNTRINDVSSNVKIHEGGCRNTTVTADRVLMGHFNSLSYLPHAVNCLDDGGTIHLHTVVPSDGGCREIREAEERIEKEGMAVESAELRYVKGYSEGLTHAVTDLEVEGRS